MILRIYRIAFLLLINLTAFLTTLPLWLLLFPIKAIQQQTLARAVMVWGRLNCLALGIAVKKKGSLKIPEGMFIVSNHLSYTDIPVLAGIFSCVFISKDAVRRWPLIGILSALAGTVFVDRSSGRSTLEALEKVKTFLDLHRNILLFPEATTSDGKTLKPFRSSFFALPERLGIPVVPVAINYYDCLTNNPCEIAPWHSEMNLLRHFWRLTATKKILAVVTICDIIKPTDKVVLSRKELAMLSENSIKEAYYRHGS